MPLALTTVLFVLIVVLVLSPTRTYAFGAGDIPDFSFLNDKAFRHGDIESILENLPKHVGGAAITGGSLLGFAGSLLKTATGGSKFSKLDVKRVYFGNWLRDYSQAMDIAGLSKLAPDTIALIVAVLGFMTFGFTTQEFEVTQDRLGVYLPVEHIDNPKGYAEAEGDARHIHPKLRPPVQAEELEIDERTGMKKYMASDNQGWDTSTAFIRRTLKACIEHGRRAGGKDNADQFEAFRLLGTGLHTLEDLLAHSNWCEIMLRKMGCEEVFCHVGDNVIVDTPNGPAPPLVTGTFGGADFLHSLLGEAGDHLSQASVTDLTSKLKEASEGGDSNVTAFKAVLEKFSIGGDNGEVQDMHEQSKAYQFDPDNIAPPEVRRQMLELLKWHDNIAQTIENIPGLSELVDELTNALNAFVYTVLAPYLVPIINSTTGILDEGSKAVIDNEDQYQVFDNPNASDPSHSILSKDHFALILNEPAGKIAQVVVKYSVDLIVKAWAGNGDPDHVLDKILEAFHHPYYTTGNSEIQNQMYQHMDKWFSGLADEKGEILRRLTKESVREHNNKRIGSEDMNLEEPGHGGISQKPQSHPQNYQSQSGGGIYAGKGYSSGSRYDNSEDQSRVGGYGKQQGSYGGAQYGGQEYGSRRNDPYSRGGYSSGSQYDNNEDQSRVGGYGKQQDSYGGAQYGGQEYGSQRNDPYSREGYSSGSRYDNTEDQSQGIGYGHQPNSYGGGEHERQEHDSRRRDSYREGAQQESFTTGYSQGSYSIPPRDDTSYAEGRGHKKYDNIDSYDRRREESGRPEEYSRRDNEGYAPSYEQYGTSGREDKPYGRSEDYGRSGAYGASGEYDQRDVYDQRSGYKSGYGGGDDTFGAERLNLADEGEDHERRNRHHHHRHHHEDDDN